MSTSFARQNRAFYVWNGRETDLGNFSCLFQYCMMWFEIGFLSHCTLVWIGEKTLVPSNFPRLLKLIFLGSWMFVCNETYVDWKVRNSAFISYMFHWWQWILLFIILVWKLCFDFWRRVSFLRFKLVWNLSGKMGDYQNKQKLVCNSDRIGKNWQILARTGKIGKNWEYVSVAL